MRERVDEVEEGGSSAEGRNATGQNGGGGGCGFRDFVGKCRGEGDGAVVGGRFESLRGRWLEFN